MKEWLEDMETKLDERHRDNLLLAAGIADMTAKVLAKTRVGEVAPAQEGRNDTRNESAREDCEGLEASQHAGAMQGGEPEQCQLQQQLKPKPKVQLKQQSEQQDKPKPKPTPTPTKRWETVQPRTLRKRAPTGPGPAPKSGSSMAETHLISRRDHGVPLAD